MTTPQHKLRQSQNPQRAQHNTQFFKAFPGGYGEGDQFLGVTVPQVRKVVREFKDLSQTEIQKLIQSPWHEERLLGLLILVDQYQRAFKKAPNQASKLAKLYIKNKKYINNWDLIDTTVHKVLGPEFYESDRSLLYKWVRSKNLWDKRLAMMTTYYFLKRGDFDDTFQFAEILRDDSHDLIHKVVGWMLREVGKLDKSAEDRFLKKHYHLMPRTMLRYAIEKYPERERKKILTGSWSY